MTPTLRVLTAVAALMVIGFVAWLAFGEYRESYAVTEPESGGPPVTQMVTARLAGMSSLKVAELSGTIQSTAADVRGFGLLKSDRVIKMPYSVDYFVDASAIEADDIEWNAETRTLIVDAPDVTVGKPNTDEGARTLVRTSGLFVTREAGEALARQTSRNAQGRVTKEANSPERLAQAREYARRAVARLLAAPLEPLGYGDARVIVTFPMERGNRDNEQMDRSRAIEEVLGNTN
ncbi:DUF4230 domain-containing protein [Sphingomonas gilva]|uniref:DUF4230 domain-containing protein n=2 Tax=Sphingomonas gilva TaxID=2305907 RepID=A0A396RMC1_9SPHN|nr:DUF4230 domain-containing protein [Sphingomonas gilva]